MLKYKSELQNFEDCIKLIPRCFSFHDKGYYYLLMARLTWAELLRFEKKLLTKHKKLLLEGKYCSCYYCTTAMQEHQHKMCLLSEGKKYQKIMVESTISVEQYLVVAFIYSFCIHRH